MQYNIYYSTFDYREIFQYQDSCQLRQDLRAEPPAQLPAKHPPVWSQTLRRLPHPSLSTDVKATGHQARPAFQGSLHNFWEISDPVFQEDEYRELVSISQSMEELFGQFFDSVIPFEVCHSLTTGN